MVLGFTIILEGCMPFFTPKLYKKFTREISQTDERILRILGFVAILFGMLILYFAKGML